MSDLSKSFGMVLDPWQENVLQAAMGERTDGTWAARFVALSTPRQNGKSQLIVARALAGILLFNEQTIIVSAHQQDTAREVFSRIVDVIEAHPSLQRRVDSIMKAVNREYIRFNTGQSIRFKARSSSSGRGFSCDCLLLDEAQILGNAAWATIVPTMSARPNPQAWLLGTPPTEGDDGEAFERMRGLGLDRKEPRIAYLEWSADKDDPVDDPETWAKANPAYGTRITHEAVATELASMSYEQFQKERLGVWDEVARHRPLVEPPQWRAMLSDGPPGDTRPNALGVDMSHGRDISIAACWVDGENAHVEQVWAGTDSTQAVEWLVARSYRRIPIVVDAASPASSLVPDLKGRRCPVTVTNAPQMGQACGLLENRISTRTLTHAGQQQLTDAVFGARRRPIRDAGGWALDRRDPTSSIYPIVAATLALFGATVQPQARPRTRRVQVL